MKQIINLNIFKKWFIPSSGLVFIFFILLIMVKSIGQVNFNWLENIWFAILSSLFLGFLFTLNVFIYNYLLEKKTLFRWILFILITLFIFWIEIIVIIGTFYSILFI